MRVVRDADDTATGWVQVDGQAVFQFEAGQGGRVDDVDIAMELETVVRGRVNQSRPQTCTLVLVDPDGQIISTTQTADDGTFAFDLPPVYRQGLYRICLARVDGTTDEEAPGLEVELYPGYGWAWG